MINKTRSKKQIINPREKLSSVSGNNQKNVFPPTNSLNNGGNDRFIPRTTSKKTYYSSSQLSSFLSNPEQLVDPQLQSRSPSPEFFSGHDLPMDTLLTQDMSSMIESSDNKNLKKTTRDAKQHRKYMADALGFPDYNRVLYFSQTKNSLTIPSLSVDPLISILPPSEALKYANSQLSNENRLQKRVSKRVMSRIPYRVLEAPHLRKDFYSNLVDWSTVTNNVAVALDTAVFLWSDTAGAIHVLKREYLERTGDTVQCLCFGPNELLLIGTKRGRILIFNQDDVNKKIRQTQTKPLLELTVRCQSGICCCQWFQDGSAFIVGTELGVVYKFNITTETVIVEQTSRKSEILLSGNGRMSSDLESKFNIEHMKLIEAWSIHVHSQQICGVKISESTQQIVIGGNDNCCTVWRYNNSYLNDEPELQFRLKHASAVKALAFCPWSKSLLVTGGGSYDRHLRFWHSKSGTLLKEFKTPGQITSIIWSKRQRQILVTFGFTNQESPVFIIMYSYPSMQEIIRIKQPTQLRALTAISSPDASKVCVASDDETVRFYSIWDSLREEMRESPTNGVFGSEIIENEEGVSLHCNIR